MICFINIAVLIVFQNLSRDMHWKLALATNVMMLAVGLLVVVVVVAFIVPKGKFVLTTQGAVAAEQRL